MQAEKWKDLDVINRKSLNRQGVRWIIKALPPENITGPWKYSDTDNEDTFIHISKMETSKPAGTRQVWPAAPPRRNARALHDFFSDKQQPAEAVKFQQVASTQNQEETGEAKNSEGKPSQRDRSPKRPAPGARESKAEGSVRERLPLQTENVIAEYKSRGWIRKDMGGSGDCGWRSLSAAVAWNHDEDIGKPTSKARWALTKTQAISYMRKHSKDFAPFLKKD